MAAQSFYCDGQFSESALKSVSRRAGEGQEETIFALPKAGGWDLIKIREVSPSLVEVILRVTKLTGRLITLVSCLKDQAGQPFREQFYL